METANRPPLSPPAFEVPAPPALSAREGAFLVRVALNAVVSHLRGDGPAAGGRTLPEPVPGPLTQPAGAFVSIYSGPNLRGCLGTLDQREPLWRAVGEMAVAAASRDPRFEPLGPGDLDQLSVEVSVLGPLYALPDQDPELVIASIRVGEHGLAVRHGGKSGLLLPQVPHRHGWDALRFLEETCRKAGLDAQAWRSKGVELRAFRCARHEGKLEAGPVGTGRED